MCGYLFESLFNESLGSRTQRFFKEPRKPNEEHVHTRDTIDEHIGISIGHNQNRIKLDADHYHLYELNDQLDDDTGTTADLAQKRQIRSYEASGKDKHKNIEYIICVNDVNSSRLRTIRGTEWCRWKRTQTFIRQLNNLAFINSFLGYIYIYNFLTSI